MTGNKNKTRSQMDAERQGRSPGEQTALAAMVAINRISQSHAENIRAIHASYAAIAVKNAAKTSGLYRNFPNQGAPWSPSSPYKTELVLSLGAIFTTPYIGQVDGKLLVIDAAKIHFEVDQFLKDSAVILSDQVVKFNLGVAIARNGTAWADDITADYPISLDNCLNGEYTIEDLGEIEPTKIEHFVGAAGFISSLRQGATDVDVTLFFQKIASRYVDSIKTGNPFPVYFLYYSYRGKQDTGTRTTLLCHRYSVEVAYHYNQAPTNKI